MTIKWKDEVISKLNLIQELLNDMHSDIAYIKNVVSSISELSDKAVGSNCSLMENFLKIELSEIKFLLNKIISLQLKKERDEVEFLLSQ